MAGVGRMLREMAWRQAQEGRATELPRISVRSRALRRCWWAVAASIVYLSSVPAGAQYPADAAGAALSPVQILASVRAAGFSPLSRPLQRGPVYELFATDRYLFDVRLTVDARTGRVLSATRLAGAIRGGPVYEGALPGEYPYQPAMRAPIPPAPVPNRRNATAAPGQHALAGPCRGGPNQGDSRSTGGRRAACCRYRAAQPVVATPAAQPLKPLQPAQSPQPRPGRPSCRFRASRRSTPQNNRPWCRSRRSNEVGGGVPACRQRHRRKRPGMTGAPCQIFSAADYAATLVSTTLPSPFPH